MTFIPMSFTDSISISVPFSPLWWRSAHLTYDLLHSSSIYSTVQCYLYWLRLLFHWLQWNSSCCCGFQGCSSSHTPRTSLVWFSFVSISFRWPYYRACPFLTFVDVLGFIQLGSVALHNLLSIFVGMWSFWIFQFLYIARIPLRLIGQLPRILCCVGHRPNQI